ncbi:hypothetical protein ACFUVU_05455 [Streptomyces griseoincarnatus]
MTSSPSSTRPPKALRTRTRPEDCLPGPTFPTDRIAADADLAVDGLLLDFKSTRYPRTLRQAAVWQLTGYLLLDTDDRYRVDTLGLYLSRSGTLATWPVEEYLELLRACRRDLLAFRTACTDLLDGCTADVEPYDQEEEDRVRKLLQRLAPVDDQGHCLVRTQPCPTSGRRPQEFCPSWCRGRARVLRNRACCPAGQTCCSRGQASSF